jgi:glycosyltransferase involved in cell wall biosynthesis
VRKILLVYKRSSSFVEIDRRLLAERWNVQEWPQPGPVPRPDTLVRAVRNADLVFGWFAAPATFGPITLASVLGKPTILNVGGFDVADLPEIGYGSQRGGPRRIVAGWTMRRATRVLVPSEFSLREVETHVGLPPHRVRRVYHGVPDPFAALPGEKERLVFTIGAVDRANLERKGLLSFVRAAALLPDVPFVHVGVWVDDAIHDLRAAAPANVTFTGWIARDEVDDHIRRASVYVQASLHEGFGLSVAEAMLGGCIPVVSDAGALPEVVGSAGIVLESREPEAIARAIEAALALGSDARAQARDRVLTEFPLERRRGDLHAIVHNLLEGKPE